MSDKSPQLIEVLETRTQTGRVEFEEILELLSAMARSEGRDFLAYLLTMALVESREGERPPLPLRH